MSTVVSTSQLSKFTLFSKLPTELRLAICMFDHDQSPFPCRSQAIRKYGGEWVRKRNYLNYLVSSADTNSLIGSFAVAPNTLRILHHSDRSGRGNGRCIQGKVPGILHANRESREVGMKIYELFKLRKDDSRAIFINWELDIFVESRCSVVLKSGYLDTEIISVREKMQNLSLPSMVDKPDYFLTRKVIKLINVMIPANTMRDLKSLTVMSRVLNGEERQDPHNFVLRRTSTIKVVRFVLREADGRETDLKKRI